MRLSLSLPRDKLIRKETFFHLAVVFVTDQILETPRLFLRKLRTDDSPFLRLILQDGDVMYAWGHAFSDREAADWLAENLLRYERDGYSYWAVIEKATRRLIGVCGLLSEQADGENTVGVGYLFRKSCWGKGYAIESAAACIDYAFDVLHLGEITAQIRPDNIPSRKVAEKLGMTVKKQFIRNDSGKQIPHLLYSRKRETSFKSPRG